MTNSVQNLKLGLYNIDLLVDDDGHLNVWIESADGSALLDVDTSQDNHDQRAMRFSTESIEKQFKEAQ